MPKRSENPGVERINPYGKGEKSGQVEEMFDSIAPAYDFMNTMMTFGLCSWWRNRALKMAAERQPDPADILDVATGTGDVAFEMLRRFPGARVEGLDLSEGMLKQARRKAAQLDTALAARVRFTQGDSLRMPFDNNRFDLVTVAYGVRNFAHLDRGLAEMARVLRPGGTLCVIELSVPANPLLRFGYNIYARHIIPVAGRMVSGDKSAYTYLPQSIAACPQRDGMTGLMANAGFENCRWKSLTFGTVTIYLGTKRL